MEIAIGFSHFTCEESGCSVEDSNSLPTRLCKHFELCQGKKVWIGKLQPRNGSSNPFLVLSDTCKDKV